jgi:hypothetical protein
MNEQQRLALQSLCSRYKVEFKEEHYRPQFDLPPGYVAGWLGGVDAGKIFVGCSPEGSISS